MELSLLVSTMLLMISRSSANEKKKLTKLNRNLRRVSRKHLFFVLPFKSVQETFKHRRSDEYKLYRIIGICAVLVC